MLVDTPESTCILFKHKETFHQNDILPKDNFDIPLPVSQDESFFILFTKIYESVKFASPPEIFQFCKLILEDNSQLTFNNIKEFEVVIFLIQLLSMSTDETVIESCLTVICMLISCSNHLLKEFLQNDILDTLPDIYSYPSPEVQTIISKLYVIITDLDNDIDNDIETYVDNTTIHIILRCSSDFLIQSVFWAAGHSCEDCQKNCLLFQYNIIVGSDNNLPKDLIYTLASSLQSILVGENISLIYYSAWAICRLIQNYSLLLDLKDVFNCLFSTVDHQQLLDSQASIPLLRMTVKTLRNTETFPPANEILPIIDWSSLVQQMNSIDHEISYLSCRVCQYLIKLGIECIDAALSNKILDIACLIFEDGSFKSKCEISYLLKNIWENGSIEQYKTVFCNRSFLLFLKFSVGAEMTNIEQCFYSMYTALKSVIDVDQSFIPVFIKSVPMYFFSDLLENVNDDVSNYSQLIFDNIYIQYDQKS